jgi:predicted metal-dependent enzyme (double-stranded beta helix superfamily)
MHPALRASASVLDLAVRATDVPADELVALAGRLAATPAIWRSLVRHDPAERWYERLLVTDHLEVWLIGWTPGQGTPLHDHGDAAGAMAVAEGALLEEVYGNPGPELRRTVAHRPGAALAFPPDHIHRVRNPGAVNATSVHAYSPPDRPMRVYSVRAAAVPAGG